ncbi:MAG: isopentenyl-diphosphate Delta-isomerase [Patescibacteria group bacterium]|nr:isopentenyl-diphosphate Delta-isomerase [Patescibacteria group bacterium]
MEKLILVDRRDRQIGIMEKLEAHKLGRLHRCFSIFITNGKGQTLLQRRALDKYHSGGLWSNSCCGHQRPGEHTLKAGERRLKEEFGIDCRLKKIHTFLYRTEFKNGLIEYEFDHVLTGYFDGTPPQPDPKEILEWKWISLANLQTDIFTSPQDYTYWLKACFADVVPLLNNRPPRA